MMRIMTTVIATGVALASQAADAADTSVRIDPPATLVTSAVKIVAPAAVQEVPLPLIDSLTADSDFTVFMQPGVSVALQNAALRVLWRVDPAFNQPDFPQ
jgi:hypothetical protein